FGQGGGLGFEQTPVRDAVKPVTALSEIPQGSRFKVSEHLDYNIRPKPGDGGRCPLQKWLVMTFNIHFQQEGAGDGPLLHVEVQSHSLHQSGADRRIKILLKLRLE